MVWDAIVADETRSKIISCVYGKTFPLIDSEIDQRGKIDSKKTFRTPTIVRLVDDSGNFESVRWELQLHSSLNED